jgi:hypothetical protein
MATRKNSKSKSKNVKVVVGSHLAAVQPAPSSQIPDVPPGFDPRRPVGRGQGPHVGATLAALAPAIAAELASPSFASDVGSKQDTSALADAIVTASAWREEKIRSQSWLRYVSEGDASVWSVVLKELERLRNAFEYAASCDPSLRARYPQLTEMFRAKSAAGVRGGATRARNRAKKSSNGASAPVVSH